MNIPSLCSRAVRFVLLRPGALLLLCLCLAVCSYLSATGSRVRSFVGSHGSGRSGGAGGKALGAAHAGNALPAQQQQQGSGPRGGSYSLASTWTGVRAASAALTVTAGVEAAVRLEAIEGATNGSGGGAALYLLLDGHRGQLAADLVSTRLLRRFHELFDGGWLNDNPVIAKESGPKSSPRPQPSSEQSSLVSRPAVAAVLKEEIGMAERELLKSLSSAHDSSALDGFTARREVAVQYNTCAFQHWSKDLLQRKCFYIGQGTSLLLLLLWRQGLAVASVGDSRAVLCSTDGKALPLTHEHKPFLQPERGRIKRAGGYISFDGAWRVQGILSTSRSLGDSDLKANGIVIAEPEIATFDPISLHSRLVLLASPGLWDAISGEAACGFLSLQLAEPGFGAEGLARQAASKASADSLAVMVVKTNRDNSGTVS
uniref:protein phosphatase 1L-like isoform X1 n=1 Tax=Myxine glutinosa TaxID=7769 RepID=UPI00358F4444